MEESPHVEVSLSLSPEQEAVEVSNEGPPSSASSEQSAPATADTLLPPSDIHALRASQSGMLSPPPSLAVGNVAQNDAEEAVMCVCLCILVVEEVGACCQLFRSWFFWYCC